MLLSNGFMGSWQAWRHLRAFLADRFRMISWDYRGLYKSDVPADPSHIRVADHATDASLLLRSESAVPAILVGWSMGVQVNLEIYRLDPAAVRAMVIICGTYGRPFETAFNWKGTGTIFPIAARTLASRPGGVSWFLRRLAAAPWLLMLARRAGAIGPSLDEALFLTLAREFGDQDVRTSTSVYGALGVHDAMDVLTTLKVPVLVIAGEADPFTPRRVAERMVRRIPCAELTMVPGGTHFVPLEHPELVNLRIEKFLCDHGLLAPGSRAGRRPLIARPIKEWTRRNTDEARRQRAR